MTFSAGKANRAERQTAMIQRIFSRRPIAAIVALSAIALAFAEITDRPPPSDGLIISPERSLLCSHHAAACEQRM
jgi:hypothetical protein